MKASETMDKKLRNDDIIDRTIATLKRITHQRDRLLNLCYDYRNALDTERNETRIAKDSAAKWAGEAQYVGNCRADVARLLLNAMQRWRR